MDFEIVEYKGQKVRRYSDGTLRNDKGHIVKLGKNPGSAEGARKARAIKAKQAQKRKEYIALRDKILDVYVALEEMWKWKKY